MKNLNPLYTLLKESENIKHTRENAAKLYNRYKGVSKELAGKLADAAWSGKSTKDVMQKIHSVEKVKGIAGNLEKGLKKLPKGVAKILK